MTVLQGTRVKLRPASADDAEARYALGTDTDIMKMFGIGSADTIPMTRHAAEEWAQALARDANAWIIEVDQRLIGEIKLHSVNSQDRRASMAIGIYDHSCLGRGMGTEAIRLLLTYAFAELKLHRIAVRVLAYNERAIRAYRKCGFVVEGRERETAFVEGEWHDDLIMGLLSRQFVADGSGGGDLELTTARTVLRPFVADDAADVFACISPEITRHMAWEPPKSPEHFAEVWTAWISSMADSSELYFVARERNGGKCLGIVGVHALASCTPELGIWLRPEVHGRRFGHELIGAVLKYVSASRTVRYFEYPVAEENIASRRIAEAFGGTVEDKRVNPKYASVVYHIPPRTENA